jgi:hypothetical protein
MVFGQANNAIIEACFTGKGWGIGQIVCEFPIKVCNKRSVERLIQKVRSTGSISRKECGSGKPRTAGTEDNNAGNKAYVEDAIAFLRKDS